MSDHGECVLSLTFTPSGTNILLELERDEEQHDMSLEPCSYSYIVWNVEQKAIVCTRTFSKTLDLVVATDSFLLWRDDNSNCLHLLPHGAADQSQSLCLELDRPLRVTDLAVNPINQFRIAYLAYLENNHGAEEEYELGVFEICLTSGEQAFGVTLTAQNVPVELSDCCHYQTNLSWLDDGRRLKLHSEKLMKVLAFDEDVQALPQGPASAEETLLAALIDKANGRFQSVLRLDPNAEIVSFHIAPDCKSLACCYLAGCKRGGDDYEDLSRIAIVTL